MFSYQRERSFTTGVSTFCATVCFTILLYLSSGAATNLVAKPSLPAGQGKALVERVCLSCHGVDVVTAPRLTKEEWTRVVYEMAGMGAEATDKELKIVIDYLAKNFGKDCSSGGKGCS